MINEDQPMNSMGGKSNVTGEGSPPLTPGLSDNLAENLTLLAEVQGSNMTDEGEEDVDGKVKMETSNAEEAKDEVMEEDGMTKALAVVNKNKEATVKSSVAQMKKHLQNLKKKPNETRYRKMRFDNIIVKKFITDVNGALDFMKAVGFEEVTEGKKKYLMVSEVHNTRLDRAIELLEGNQANLASTKDEPKKEAKRVKCLGGCGFWGDESQEGYCSLCHKKKVVGGKPVAQSGPKKCIKECGFFGAEKFKGMCSVCWGKESKVKANTWKPKLKRARTKLNVVRAFTSAPRLRQKNKKRCWKCKRKVGITGIECRCGYIFCGKHRYADEHNCIFDHRSHHQRKLRQENKQILTKKLDKVED